MTARTHTPGARRALTVLAGAAVALGLGAVASPAMAADTDADLELLDSAAGQIYMGNSGSFSIGAKNSGPAESTNWTATATFTGPVAIDPTSLTYGGTGDISCTVVSDQEIACAGEILAVNEAAFVAFAVTASELGNASWEAHVFPGDQVDPDDAGDRDVSGTIEILPPNDPDPVGSGDWGKSGEGLMAPGTSTYDDVAFTCLSVEGCDYGPGMTITDQAINGASFNAGTNTIFINGATSIGNCQVTTANIDCEVTQTGHANQGDVIGSKNIAYEVAVGTPADTQVFAQTIAFPAGWTGNDTSNDVYPISTPPEVGAPIASWQAGAGIGGLALLLGGGALVLRRRQQVAQPVAA